MRIESKEVATHVWLESVVLAHDAGEFAASLVKTPVRASNIGRATAAVSRPSCAELSVLFDVAQDVRVAIAAVSLRSFADFSVIWMLTKVRRGRRCEVGASGPHSRPRSSVVVTGSHRVVASVFGGFYRGTPVVFSSTKLIHEFGVHLRSVHRDVPWAPAVGRCVRP